MPRRAGGRFLPLGLAVAWTSTGPGFDGRVTPAPGEAEDDGSGVVVRSAGTWATRRKRSCAWRTTVSTRLSWVAPGTWTTIWLLPWVLTVASVTPEPLTRLSMMLAASLRLSFDTSALGGQHDLGAALEVETECGLPGADQGHQAVGERQTDEEHRDGAPRSSACCVPSTASPPARRSTSSVSSSRDCAAGVTTFPTAARTTRRVTPSATSSENESSSKRAAPCRRCPRSA